jgi:hypothetical protein
MGNSQNPLSEIRQKKVSLVHVQLIDQKISKLEYTFTDPFIISTEIT